MQSAEASAFGQQQQGAAAAYMKAAATLNEQAGLVSPSDVADVARDQGVTITHVNVPGGHVVTEQVGEQAVGQFVQPLPGQQGGQGEAPLTQNAITIGQGLEAAAQTSGEKPVDQGDAAAIQAAEARATGSAVINIGGLTATAQAAAAFNATLNHDEDKVKLGSVLAGARTRMVADKVATREDMQGVVTAELRNNPNLTSNPGGVAESVVAAARLNERANG